VFREAIDVRNPKSIKSYKVDQVKLDQHTLLLFPLSFSFSGAENPLPPGNLIVSPYFGALLGVGSIN
jgi:hypothetical protein